MWLAVNWQLLTGVFRHFLNPRAFPVQKISPCGANPMDPLRCPSYWAFEQEFLGVSPCRSSKLTGLTP
jgi:hypothetical protein